jgi:hypothetical protein
MLVECWENKASSTCHPSEKLNSPCGGIQFDTLIIFSKLYDPGVEIVRRMIGPLKCQGKQGIFHFSDSGYRLKQQSWTNQVQRFKTPYSHSIVLDHGNALIFQSNSFLHATKHRLPDPSEIHALDFKGEFRRFGICSVPATIGVYWSIF